jgi:hypothetical protein
VCKLKIKPPRSQFEYILSTSPSAVQPLSPSAPQQFSPSAPQQFSNPILFLISPILYYFIQAPQQFSTLANLILYSYPIFLSKPLSSSATLKPQNPILYSYPISYIPYPLLFYPSPSAVQHSSKPYPLFLSYILIQAPQQFSNPKTLKPYPIFLSYIPYPLFFYYFLIYYLLLLSFQFIIIS